MMRLRLSLAYAVIMLVGLLLFAAAALFSIDRVQRATLDARLMTAGRAAAALIDLTQGRIVIDADDRKQLLSMLGAQAGGAVFDAHGKVVLSSRVGAIMPLPVSRVPALFNVGHGDGAMRVFALPLVRANRQMGTIVVWRDDDWIDETDRNVAIAFGAAALAIAGLALIGGNLVTRRALEDAFSRQRRFTADASHELRAPLAVIRAEADLALRKPRDRSSYRAAMETIAAESDRMEAIVGDLLAAARAERHRGHRHRVRVADLLEAVGDRLSSAAAAKRAAIRIRCEGDARIFVDSAALERALLAIGHNALKYTLPGTSIDLIARSRDARVDISVRDGGPGFSNGALAHGLERFWHEPLAGEARGSGLGLSIARSIVEANGGEIALTNAPDGGACVALHFAAVR